MNFAQPIWLVIGLLACAALVWLYRRHDARQRAALATFASGHLVKQLTASFSRRRQTFKRVLFITGAALLFVALARPQWGFRWEETKRKGIDILFAVDTSKSMLAQDVKPDRLTRAKLAVTDLVGELEGDRIGLIAFAGNAFLQSPLTLDYDAFRQSLDALDAGIIPRGGTNVASAIEEAREAFGESTKNHKILVLITDGEDLEAQGIRAASAAAKEGLKIYTVGVGNAAGELIPLPAEGGGTEFAKDESGALVKSRLDEATLRQVAEATGAIYEPLGQQGQGLEAIYQQALAPLPKQELTSRMQKVFIERFQWPLALGLACLLVELLIGTRKSRGVRRFIPVPARRSPRRREGIGRAVDGRDGSKVQPASVAALLALTVAVQASPQSAEKAYENGKFDAAREQYAAAAAKHPEQAELQFNLGAAAYKSGDFAKAAPAFRKTLESDQLGLQQQAYYNLGNTQFRLGQQTAKEQPQETIKTWQSAVQSYEGALKLNANDADAKFNLELVKRKLEELQKQEQRKQEQQKKEQEQKDQQDQQKQDQPKDQKDGEKPKEDQKDQPQPGAGKDDEKEDGKPDPQKPGDGDSKDEPKDGDKPKDQPENKDGKGAPKNEPSKADQTPGDKPEAGEQPKPGEKPESGEQPKASGEQPKGQADAQEAEAQRVPGEMSKQEAKALLDSLKKGDRRMPISPTSRGAGVPQDQQPRKDW